MMGLIFAMNTSAPAVVTLSGETITHDVDGIGATAGIRFNTDGTIDKREGVVYTQIDTGTDWIRPTELADSSYDVRFTALSGDAFTVAAAPEDSWIALSADREWNLQESGGSVKGNTVTFEIRRGGVTLDTASYTFTADDAP